jgi:hypothetical protein
MKKPSKGVNGEFKVPWGAGSPHQAEAQKKEEGLGGIGTGQEEARAESKPPTREPSLEEQQIHQLMSAKKAEAAQARKEEAAQARAQAVKVS